MDRVFKAYSRPGCLFAELSVHYDRPDRVSASLQTYSAIENDDDGEKSYSVYPSMHHEVFLNFRRFASIQEATAHDWEVVRKYADYDIDPALKYTYGYDADPVLERYILENHIGCQAVIDFRYSFAGNTKSMTYRSAEHPRFDHDLNTTGMESHADCMLQIPLFHQGEQVPINFNDLRRLDPWY